MILPYTIIEPKVNKVPIIVSVPHSGTDFPDEIKKHFVTELRQKPDDTDWFVDKLYDFVEEIGITMIFAKYSRWVIDLNRDPESKPLYNDGRIITSLSPSTNFFGDQLYADEKYIPSETEIENRLNNYYWPYYKKVEELLNERKTEFGKALLWDAHSIRQLVPTIRKDKFPDFILGNNDQKTAHPQLINTALEELGKGKYELTHNTPFKGGHITRYFGDPSNNIHSLQLEMSKILYMNDNETEYDMERANEVRVILKNTFSALIETLSHI